MQREPADLRAIVAGVDASAEGRGHELRAQTNPQNRLARGEALGDEGDLVFEEGIVLVVVDADGAAEDDEEVAGFGLRQGEAGLGGN